MADGQRHLSFNILETKYGTIIQQPILQSLQKVSWIGRKRNILPYPFNNSIKKQIFSDAYFESDLFSVKAKETNLHNDYIETLDCFTRLKFV